jgi:hypothetical protein
MDNSSTCARTTLRWPGSLVLRTYDKERVGFSVCKSTTLLPNIAKARNITMPMLYHDDPAKRSIPTATKSRHGQTSSKYELLQPWLHLAGIWWLLRPEQLNDPDTGPILQEVEPRQQPKWKDTADCSPMHKNYWAQWKSHVVRNGILKHNWEFANGRSQ